MPHNRTIFYPLILIAILLLTNIANATTKHAISKRHDTDIAHILQTAKNYLQQRIDHNKQHKKLAVVFDINRQTLANLQQKRHTHFITPPGIFHDVSTYQNTQIAPMLDFYKFAEKNRLSVFFITCLRLF